MNIKVSDYIFDFLSSKGIDTFFLVSGGAAGHLLNSVNDKNINYICNYHEQACAMAAEGYALVTNKPAGVLVTNGPGSTNTVTGVLGAYQSSIPMFIISGQVPTHQTLTSLNENVKLRQLGVQECDIISIISSITKYAVQIVDSNTIRYHMEAAFHKMMEGRMGPVWIDVPLDIQNSYIDPDSIQSYDVITDDCVKYNIDSIMDLILKSKRPLVVVGNGVHLSKSEDLLKQFISSLNIPFVSTWTSKDIFDYNYKSFVGNFGILGERAANFSVQSADLLLILGCRLSIPNIGYNTRAFSPKSLKIMVDIDGNELNKHTIKVDYAIQDDVNNFLQLMLKKTKPIYVSEWDSWRNITQEWKKKYPVFSEEHKLESGGINSFYFMKVLSDVLKRDSIIVTDMGTSFTCTMQSLRLDGTQRLITSSACCSMGFGLPGAIGAYYSSKEKEIILITGDGGFQMNIQELQTIAHNNIPIKIFILNNNGYRAISLMQDSLFDKKHVGSTNDSGVSSPNFSLLGRVYGFYTCRLEDSNTLKHQMDSIMNMSGRVICEIMMPENQVLLPRVQSIKDTVGNIKSTSLETMSPYIEDEDFKKILKNYE